LTDGPESVEEWLSQARRELNRLSPGDAHAAMGDGAFLVDIRSDAQRAADA
jgi:hypothetical protein